MSQKPENVFIDSINNLLPIHRRAKSLKARQASPGVLIHYEKMNNPYHSGTADSWYSGKKGDLWVEYKYLPRVPQRASVKPDELLSALQLEWLNGRHEEGRNVVVIVGCPVGGVILREHLWERELEPNEFVSLIRSRPALSEFIREQTCVTR